ncbi:unnamed protein product [Adineta steineri]|uniref:Uncharacterized protein n=1 Tax=Adineta steineri TaxID=433720 RepID=A0A813S278_9BILA|nr:unnamed protein product [Adineta steineri]CAF1351031.1 unnamed protein product [Adineta steineri]CAF3546520.1 unnamed protein product [Adineta steineri]CAF4227695.1 unnamed protein product [Adineta steineri]
MQIANTDACSQYSLSDLYWLHSNRCNTSSLSYPPSISTQTIIAILNYHWMLIFLCTACLSITFIIVLYFYKQQKHAQSSKVAPANVIITSSASQIDDLNDPISFVQLSLPPPYTSVFTNISE